MSFIHFILTTLLFLFSHVVHAVPIIVDPGTVNDLVITHNNTINATTPAGDAFAPDSPPASYLKLALVNKLGSDNVKAYVTGLNENYQLVFLNSAGDWYYPNTTSGTPVPLEDSEISIQLGGQGSTTHATIPGYLMSSRVWFADGPLKFYVVGTPNGPGLVEPAAVNPNDPNAATNYGFAELNWSQGGGLFADISFVDFVGMPIGIELRTTDGSGSQQALGLIGNAVNAVCNDLKSQGKSDGQPWAQSCVYTEGGQLMRVLAPNTVVSQQNSAFRGYFDDYVKQVFQAYASTPLVINTQAAAGNVKCHANVSSMTLTCDGDNRAYAAPSAADIFGCNSGPFSIQPGDNGVHYAVVPRLCAAFNRGTFLVGGGSTQPSMAPLTYYTGSASVFNWYSKIVHKYESNARGYAFSYDDVSPSDADNVAGVVSSGAPDVFTILVGGYDL